jgi:leader peptidase (prepilin peptidase) / N-methyltransferase
MSEPALLALLAGAAGGAFGFFADRLATRWPEHEPDVEPRGLDWRTLLVALAGAAVSAGLVLRWDDPRDLLLLYIYCAALLVLLATDLDQKLLPDLITLPLIVFSGAILLLGWSPLLSDGTDGLLSGILAGLGTPLFLAVTDFLLRGALGFGDLKLAVSLGFVSGVTRLFSGFLISSLLISVLLVVLILARRIGLRTAIPFGPILIGAAFLAVLLP